MCTVQRRCDSDCGGELEMFSVTNTVIVGEQRVPPSPPPPSLTGLKQRTFWLMLRSRQKQISTITGMDMLLTELSVTMSTVVLMTLTYRRL